MTTNEFLAIVNENDEIISKAKRDEIHNSGKLHRETSILIVNQNNEILIQKRSDNNKLDYSASGHVLYNEDYKEAAEREIKEELGLTITKFNKIGKFKIKSNDQSKINNRFICLFEVKDDYKITDLKINKKEVKSIDYYSKSKLKEIIKNNPDLMCAGFIDLLNKYLEEQNDN